MPPAIHNFVVHYDSGEWYDGALSIGSEPGLREGRGKMVYARQPGALVPRALYEGEWARDLRHGVGEMRPCPQRPPSPSGSARPSPNPYTSPQL